MTLACLSSSARPLSTSPPGNVPKASQRECEQMTESVPFESRLPSREAVGRIAHPWRFRSSQTRQPCGSTPDRPNRSRFLAPRRGRSCIPA
jgi:hypothetical protein